MKFTEQHKVQKRFGILLFSKVPGQTGTLVLPDFGQKYFISVTGIGGGSGGASGGFVPATPTRRAGGPGGSSAAWAKNFMIPVSGGESLNWQVGAGGAGGIANAGNSGAGTSTFLGDWLTLGGGQGSVAVFLWQFGNIIFTPLFAPAGGIFTLKGPAQRFASNQQNFIGNGYAGANPGYNDPSFALSGLPNTSQFHKEYFNGPVGGLSYSTVTGGGGGGGSPWGNGGDATIGTGTNGDGYGSGGAGGNGDIPSNGGNGRGGFLFVQYFLYDDLNMIINNFRR